MMKLWTRVIVTAAVVGIIWFPFVLKCDLDPWNCSIDLHRRYKKPLEHYKNWKKKHEKPAPRAESICEVSECSSRP